MSEDFALKVDRLISEIENEAIADGRDFTLSELLSETYTRLFNESSPIFEYDLPDKAKVEVLLACFDRRKRASDFTPLEFLQLQYHCWFNESLTYNFMTIHTEEELLTALRDCLKSGKPYELPDEINSLVEQGAIF